MVKRKRIPLAFLAIGSLALAACSDGGAGSGEPLESIDIMAPFFSPVPPEEDDPIDKALSDIAGLDISVQWVPNSDYGAKTNTVLAGDDIPDVMVIQGKDQAFVQTAEAGGFWDLTEQLASGDYPNLVTENPDVQEASSVNGKVYGVYRARDVIRSSVIIRQDWLDNLGLALPETTDDLYEIARAFTEDDPDGNGENDTYGMINPAWSGIGNGSPYDAMEVWHGAGNLWTRRGRRARPLLHHPGVEPGAPVRARPGPERLRQPRLRHDGPRHLERAVPERPGRHHPRRPVPRHRTRQALQGTGPRALRPVRRTRRPARRTQRHLRDAHLRLLRLPGDPPLRRADRRAAEAGAHGPQRAELHRGAEPHEPRHRRRQLHRRGRRRRVRPVQAGLHRPGDRGLGATRDERRRLQRLPDQAGDRVRPGAVPAPPRPAG